MRPWGFVSVIWRLGWNDVWEYCLIWIYVWGLSTRNISQQTSAYQRICSPMKRQPTLTLANKKRWAIGYRKKAWMVDGGCPLPL
jgi:hypothetical protein